MTRRGKKAAYTGGFSYFIAVDMADNEKSRNLSKFVYEALVRTYGG